MARWAAGSASVFREGRRWWLEVRERVGERKKKMGEREKEERKDERRKKKGGQRR